MEKENFLSQLVEQSSTAVYVADYETNELLYLNQAAFDMLGIAPGEYSGMTCHKFLMNLDEPCPFCHRTVLNEQTFLSRAMMHPKTKRKYCIKSKLMQWENRKVHIHYVTDETELMSQQTQREHHYEEEIRLKKIVNSNVKLFALANLTQNILLESEIRDIKLEHMPDVPLDEIIQKLCREFVYPSEQKEYLEHFARENILKKYAAGVTHGYFRHQFGTINGWYESSYDVIENPYTDDLEVVATLRDVSELVRSEQIVDTLMNSDYECIMTIDVQTGIPTVFGASDKLEDVIAEQQSATDTRVGVENYLRKHCVDEDLDRVIRETGMPYIQERLEEVPVHTTLYSLSENGKIIRKRAIYSYLDESKRTLLCARQDVTEAYRQEEIQKKQLKQALTAAKLANSSKTDFFSRMSHDMRTPMNGILGITALSEDETDITVLKENLNKIAESGQYLLGLINDTLDFQRIESGKLSIEPTIVDADETLRNVLDMIKPTVDKKHLQFRVNKNNVAMESYIRVDPIRLKQIFINLLSNAVKFTPQGGAISLEMECLGREGMISHDRFHFSDTGIGMSEDFIQNNIFKPFSQERNEVTGMYAGSGLGLSIAKSLIELMGGTISVVSELGAGTTFIVDLDFERVSEQEAIKLQNSAKKRKEDVSKTLAGRNILLVEDHPLNAEIAIKLLEKVGCRVDWAENGEAGVQQFERSDIREYDAILMDIRMPVLNGLEATRQIRGLEREDATQIPILAMTANAYEEDIRTSYEAGMNAHISKPISPVILYETLGNAITEATAK